MRTQRARRRTALVLATAAVVLLPACGTRLSDQEAVDQLRAAQGAGGGSVSQGAGGSVTLDDGTGAGVDALGGGLDGLGGPAHGAVDPDTGAPVPGAGTSGAAPGSDGAAPAPGGAAPAPGGAGAAPRGGGGPKKPIILGIVGNFSGVIGAANAAARDTAAAWVQATNAKGGIDGHQIKLLIADDGGNAANDISNVRRLVEQEGAIAILSFFAAPGGDDAVGKYAQEKGIAIVGGSGFEASWNKYTTMFPTTTGPVPQAQAFAVAMKDLGVKRVGSVHCVEAPACENSQKDWADHAQKIGLEVVYAGQASLAQPDFTSACSSARGAGAESVLTILDGNSSLRYARDCARQQYNHKIVLVNPSNDATRELEGGVGVITAFPWLLRSGSPALEEYGAAVNKYVKNTTNAFSAYGWTAAKLMEQALTGNVSDTPKPSDVLNGLYKLKNETLGGLSQPLNFTPGKPSPIIPCAWKVVVKDAKWTAPAGANAVLCP